MRLKKFITGLLIFALLILPAAAVDVPENSAQSMILMDADTKRVLLEENADEPMLIASTTKIMTALVILEHCALEDTVEIQSEWTGIEGSSVYLIAGEKLTVEELLYCLLLQSGNDAAVSLACYCAGSVENFAQLMNERAEELGLQNSHFANPHGLDDEAHYSSARDLALITAEAMQYESFCRIVSTESITIGQRYLTNHNKMLKFYNGATGVKTGYTKAAGRSLVTSAQRDGMRLIAVTLDDPNDWADHTALLDYGFEEYRCEQLCAAGEGLASVPVIGGEVEQIQVQAIEDSSVTLMADEVLTVDLCLPRFVYAQVEEGQRIGLLRYYVNGKLAGEVPLVSDQTVARQTTASRTLWDVLSDFFYGRLR